MALRLLRARRQTSGSPIRIAAQASNPAIELLLRTLRNPTTAGRGEYGYRFFLKQSNLANSTINVRLVAGRRLAYEAADAGLLSPELAAGVRRGKGAKRLGVRTGNWLTVEHCKNLRQAPPADSVRGKCDGAILALQIGCGFWRAALVGLKRTDFQIPEDHWIFAYFGLSPT